MRGRKKSRVTFSKRESPRHFDFRRQGALPCHDTMHGSVTSAALVALSLGSVESLPTFHTWGVRHSTYHTHMEQSAAVQTLSTPTPVPVKSVDHMMWAPSVDQMEPGHRQLPPSGGSSPSPPTPSNPSPTKSPGMVHEPRPRLPREGLCRKHALAPTIPPPRPTLACTNMIALM